MKLRDLIKETPRFSREIPIGIEIDVSGQAALVLGLAMAKDPWGGHPLNQLYVLHQMDVWEEDDIEVEIEEVEMTNRQFLVEEMTDQEPDFPEIEKFIVNGHEFEVEDSEDSFLDEENHFLVLLLRYFAGEGKIPPMWMEKDTESLILTQYNMSPEIYKVNWDADILRVEVEAEEFPEEIYVGKVMKCPCGHYDTPEKYQFKGKDGKLHNLFIHGLILFNPWENIDDEEMISDLEEFLGSEDRLLVVEYETDGDLQLQFYTKEYLDAELDSNLLVDNNQLPGQFGSHIQRCALDVVSADFSDDVEIELLSYYL